MPHSIVDLDLELHGDISIYLLAIIIVVDVDGIAIRISSINHVFLFNLHFLENKFKNQS